MGSSCDSSPLIIQEALCKQVMIQTAKSVIYGKLSKNGAESFLEYTKQNVVLLASIWSSQHGTKIDPSSIVAQIPATRESVFHLLGLEPLITTQACCRKCFALYPLKSEESHCSEAFLSAAQLYSRWAQSKNLVPTCGQALWGVSSSKNRKPVRRLT